MSSGSEEAGPSSAPPPVSDYDVPKPSRIKLKTTKEERASRIYRRLQRQQQREAERISRANGYAVSPPPSSRPDSTSPPRHRTSPRRKPPDLEEDELEREGGYRWMGGYGSRAMEELARREEGERLEWLAREEVARAGGDPFAAYGMGGAGFSGVNIPKRWKAAAGLPEEKRKRRAEAEVSFDTDGGIPPLGDMTEGEYAEWVRQGMYRLKHRAEIEAAEQRRRAKEEKERQEEVEREKAERAERKRIKRLKEEKSKGEEEKRRQERKRYKARWEVVGERGGEIELQEMRLDEVPWPVYNPLHGKVRVEDLDKARIGEFLWAVARDEVREKGGGGESQEKEEMRRVLRDAIRAYHPDRFFGRILSRVREEDRDLVKEGVEKVSRAINDLAAEEKAKAAS